MLVLSEIHMLEERTSRCPPEDIRFTMKYIVIVKNHKLKLMALPYSGFACPPLAVISIHQLK